MRYLIFMSFKFSSVGHFFASLLKGIHIAADWSKKHQTDINKGLESAAGVAGVVGAVTGHPEIAAISLVVARASETAFGKVAEAIDAAGAAADQHGVNVVLDVATVQAFKEAIEAVKKVHPDALNPSPALIAAPK